MLLGSIAIIGTFAISALTILKSDSNKQEQQPIIINNNIHETDVSAEINKIHEELLQMTHDKAIDNDLYDLNKEIAECINKIN